MKNNLLKRVILPLCMLLTLSLSSCKKKFESPEPSAYDKENRVFRIKVGSSENAPFKLTMQRVNKDASVDPIDVLNIDQRTGAAFEFGFTPAVGETIIVSVTSSKQNINAYCYYKGRDTWRVDLGNSGTAGSYTGERRFTISD